MANQGPTSRVSRRKFLKAGGAGLLFSAASTAAVPFAESVATVRGRWDYDVDIVVVGSGAAALTAALFAHEGGAKVLVLEKSPLLGGTSAKSGGVYLVPNNSQMRAKGLEDPREDCLRFMARTAYPMLYNPNNNYLGLLHNNYELLAAYYDNGAAVVDKLQSMGVLTSSNLYTATKQMEQDYWPQLPENKASVGRLLVCEEGLGGSSSSGGGATLIRKLKAGIEKRGIPILLEHRAHRLVINRQGVIVGLEAINGDTLTVSARARRAVIFGSGGFTMNPELCQTFLRGPIFGGCAVPSNEGDFVYSATGVGAQLANMTQGWWSPIILDLALQSRSTPVQFFITADSFIQVNCYGRRVMNEEGVGRYNERTQSHFTWDPQRGQYSNAIQFAIYDQRCREKFGRTGGAILRPGLAAPYVLSGQTLEELTGEIEVRLRQLADRTGNFKLDPSFTVNLRETITRFNQFATTGVDVDFHRGEVWNGSKWVYAMSTPPDPGEGQPNPTMYPIASTGPYYCVLICAGTMDTKGGPKINAKAQVLDKTDQPIAGLYGAGNCIGSPAGQGYFGPGTTLGMAIVFGAIAGRNASVEKVKEET